MQDASTVGVGLVLVLLVLGLVLVLESEQLILCIYMEDASTVVGAKSHRTCSWCLVLVLRVHKLEPKVTAPHSFSIPKDPRAPTCET